VRRKAGCTRVGLSATVSMGPAAAMRARQGAKGIVHKPDTAMPLPAARTIGAPLNAWVNALSKGEMPARKTAARVPTGHATTGPAAMRREATTAAPRPTTPLISNATARRRASEMGAMRTTSARPPVKPSLRRRVKKTAACACPSS